MARRDHIQFPWESEGWATDEFRAGRNAELDAVVAVALRGAPSLYGVRQSRIFVNPWMSAIPMGVGALIGCVLWWFSDRELTWSVVFFAGLIVVGIVLARVIWMIPGWHRARAAARSYTEARGIPFPRELRWYA